MRDIDYEKSKIDFVYAIAERCVKDDQNVFIRMLIDRLKLLDQITNQAESLPLQIQKLHVGAEKVIPHLVAKEKAELQETRQCLEKAVTEI